VYDRELFTGLGDRLLVLVGISALAHLQDPMLKVIFVWENRYHWTFMNYDLEELKASVQLPPNLHLVSSYQCQPGDVVWQHRGGELSADQGNDAIPELIPRTTTDGREHSVPAFLAAYSAMAGHVDFRPPAGSVEVSGLVDSDADVYLCLHIRGSDKKGEAADFTRRVLERVGRDYPIVVVTDDPELAANITGSIRVLTVQARGRNAVFADLQVLQGAAGIIQHSPEGWSAFSNMASLFRGTPLINTFDPAGDATHWVYRPHMFREHGATLPLWFNYTETAAFLGAVRRRLAAPAGRPTL
jgi:hypothetical protein